MAAYFPELSARFAAWLPSLDGLRVAVVGHARPDGDCIGAQVALARVLASRGLEVLCVNADPVPRRLQFLAEGLLLGFGGGLLGILLGVLLSVTLLSRAGWTPHFAPGTLLLLAGGSAAFGIAAGIRPANEAAALDPAATLRLE